MNAADNRDKTTRRVILGELSATKYTVLSDWLKKDNVIMEFANEAERLMEMLSKERYQLCMVNWLLGGIGPFELIRKIRSSSLNPDIRVMVISRQVQKINIQNAINAGAHDFLAEPFENEIVLKRVLYHLTPQSTMDASEYEDRKLMNGDDLGLMNLFLEVCEKLSRSERGTEPHALHEAVSKISQIMGSNRTSLVVADVGQSQGVVLASSDDPSFHNFPISLDKYPEIQHVVFSGKVVLIPDVNTHMLTHDINKNVRTIPIGSLLVFPVRYQNEVIGVLTIRRPRASEVP
ncbi:MAG: response regulator, partial [Pseudomonadota bacterium]